MNSDDIQNIFFVECEEALEATEAGLDACKTGAQDGETINAMQTIQAFTLENLQSRRFRDAVEHSFRVAVRRTRVRALLTAIATTPAATRTEVSRALDRPPPR